MDGDRLNWNPRGVLKEDEITPESFTESFWHLATNQGKQSAPEKKSWTLSSQNHNLKAAPDSVLKGWMDFEFESLYASQALKTENSFSFVPMYSHNNYTNAVDTPVRQRMMLPSPNGGNQEALSNMPSPAHKIQPNGIAPIGSEIQKMRKAQNKPDPQRTSHLDGSHSRNSSSTSSTVTITPALLRSNTDRLSHGATLNEIRQAFPSPGGLWNRDHTSSEQAEAAFRSGASEHDQFFYPPTGAKQQLPLATARSNQATTQADGVSKGSAPLHSIGGGGAPSINANKSVGMLSHVSEAQAPHIMFRRDLSSEDLAALQAQSFQAGQRQIVISYENDRQAMVEQYNSELAEKDIQLLSYQKAVAMLKAKLAALQTKYDTHVIRMTEEFKAMQQKMDRFGQETKTLNEEFSRQKDKILTVNNNHQEDKVKAISNVTPTNQVVFKEPATHAPPVREQLALHSDTITAESQVIKAASAAFTFPGATHPNQYAKHAIPGYGSPDCVIQQRLSANGSHDQKLFDDKQFEVIVNISDDVFDDPSQRPGPGLQSFFKTLGFQQKGLHEALSSCFGKVEQAVRLVPLVKMTGHAQSEAIRNVIVMCQEHIEHRSEVYSILSHKDEKYLLIAGVVNNLITKKVFHEPIITAFKCEHQSMMIQTWGEEQQCRELDITNIERRSWLGKQRAEVANLVIKTNGFWKWVKDHSHLVTNSIMTDIQAAVPKSYHATLHHNLWAAVNDAIRIAVRIRQDPRYFEYHFQRVGCTWDNRYMVARNPELVGQELGNVRTPYVTRCTTRPLVKVKNFDGFDGTNSTIHKSEVLLSERKNTLRPYGRPGQFARGHR